MYSYWFGKRRRDRERVFLIWCNRYNVGGIHCIRVQHRVAGLGEECVGSVVPAGGHPKEIHRDFVSTRVCR